MLTTFTSQADADVIMFGEVASQILALLGKDPQATQGIFTPEQLPAAIARLQEMAEQDRRESAVTREAQAEEEDVSVPREVSVRLGQRIVPLQTMLQRAMGAQTPVIWRSTGQPMAAQRQ